MSFKKHILVLGLIAIALAQKDTSITKNDISATAKQPNEDVNSTSTIGTTTLKSITTTEIPPIIEKPTSQPEKTTPIPNDVITNSTDYQTTENPIISETTTLPSETTTQSLEISDNKEFNFIVINDTTKVPCTLSMMNITLTVPYETTNNTIETKNLTVPLNANATGTCEENVSVLTLMWQETEETNHTFSDGVNSLSMNIVKDGDVYYIQYLVVTIFLDNVTFPNASESVIKANSTKDLKLFQAPILNTIYKCNKTQNVQAGNMTIHVDNVEFIAFNTNKTISANGKAEYCALEKEKPKEKEKKKSKVGLIIGGIVIALIGIAILIFIINRYSKRMTSWNLTNPAKTFRT